MELIFAIVIGLVLLFIAWKILSGIIRAFGLILVLGVLAWYLISTGAV